MTKGPEPSHPIRALMEKRGWDEEQLAERLSRRKRRTSARYLEHILARRKRPSFGFACDLAKIFDNEISVEEILKAGTRPDGRSVAA